MTPTSGCNTCSEGILHFAVVGQVLTLVTTARMAMPCMMGCQAPMSCAFCGTMRRNWVVSFQASNRISNMLLIRARRGARGNDATKRVTKPNCITVKVRGYIHRWSFHLLKISICEHVHFIYSKCGRWRQDQVAEFTRESYILGSRSTTALEKPARWWGQKNVTSHNTPRATVCI